MIAYDSAWTGSSMPLGAQAPKAVGLAAAERAAARARSLELARGPVWFQTLGPPEGAAGGCVTGTFVAVGGVSVEGCIVIGGGGWLPRAALAAGARTGGQVGITADVFTSTKKPCELGGFSGEVSAGGVIGRVGASLDGAAVSYGMGVNAGLSAGFKHTWVGGC